MPARRRPLARAAGRKLRALRTRLGLSLRDVAWESDVLSRDGIPQFRVVPSQLVAIENSGRLPNIYRLYSLAKIYGKPLRELLRWYGVPADR